MGNRPQTRTDLAGAVVFVVVVFRCVQGFHVSSTCQTFFVWHRRSLFFRIQFQAQCVLAHFFTAPGAVHSAMVVFSSLQTYDVYGLISSHYQHFVDVGQYETAKRVASLASHVHERERTICLHMIATHS